MPAASAATVSTSPQSPATKLSVVTTSTLPRGARSSAR